MRSLPSSKEHAETAAGRAIGPTNVDLSPLGPSWRSPNLSPLQAKARNVQLQQVRRPLSKDCPEPRHDYIPNKAKEPNKTGMFVGVCEETHRIGLSISDIDNNDFDNFENNEFCGASSATQHENWLADTGATSHITMSDTNVTDVEHYCCG